MANSTWWAIPAAVASVAVLAYALVQLTVEPESVKKKRHAMHLLNEVQTISDAVVVKLHALDDDVLSLQQCNPDEHDDAPNDVPLNSYYHFDSTGKKLKTKWDTYDVDAELNKLDEEETGAADVAAAKPSRSQVKPRPSTAVLLRKVGELEHEFEAVRRAILSIVESHSTALCSNRSSGCMRATSHGCAIDLGLLGHNSRRRRSSHRAQAVGRRHQRHIPGDARPH
ncbi:hypothetical protein H310_03112 [Aphanomyces invadans]|uniref:Uncharacterized protein n=1 Tax=Aphanomyces invadans TaxID=157072 RepID=A0A024UME2_9STRA|nr:hypothetical protein H310_03112 [Aphanomyces invadans]ETW07017.1 hypothetical protein H310_03112 [Aphanomyces invadans]|eukprot:XP_008865092.1 hypothetical protein H310_03112 [Aphanomyces invadans]